LEHDILRRRTVVAPTGTGAPMAEAE